MAVRVAINGFGRIGRLTLRAAMEAQRDDIEFVAINDLGPVEANAHLFEFDTVHGRYNHTVTFGDDWLDVGKGRITVTNEPDPADLPWSKLGIDVVMECTGKFVKKDLAVKHLEAGAKRVLVSAPAEGADLTMVYGVNHHLLSPAHSVISNASCTTNCLAPVTKILNDLVGIERGYMSTVHSFTGDQPTLDTLHRDLRRARTASASMIPTTTGAMKALIKILPELTGRLQGGAIRVPTPNVSLVDLTFDSGRKTSIEEINAAMIEAEQGSFKGILRTNTKPLVSIDFNHDPASSIFDLTQTTVIDDTFVRVVSWYDNEWGFSNRMSDAAAVIGAL